MLLVQSAVADAALFVARCTGPVLVYYKSAAVTAFLNTCSAVVLGGSPVLQGDNFVSGLVYTTSCQPVRSVAGRCSKAASSCI